MLPYLFHIYGPFYANCYGIAIACGIVVLTQLVSRDPRRALLISEKNFQNLILIGTIVGVIGARLLWIASNLPMSWYEAIEIWEGGFAVQGTMIAILICMPFYLRSIKVAALPLLDLVSVYVPLMHAISRLGCFLAGCCHGLPTNLPWGVIYTHPDVQIPDHFKFIAIHPTQLYSVAMLFGIFLLMRYYFQPRLLKTGELTACYLILAGIERIIVDFWRADREFFAITNTQFLSVHQWIGVGIIICGTLLMVRQIRIKN